MTSVVKYVCLVSIINHTSILISTLHNRSGTPPNVIIFGATGAGKSSVVNMLPGGREAAVSSTAKGETFRHDRYEKFVGGYPINVFDTVGLGEGKKGTVSAAKAIEALYQLMRGLDDGVSLLVYVVRGPRLSESIRKNYELFYEIFCQKKVPIVLVITGLENEDDMDGWWERNKEAYKDENMTFAGASCITAIKGKKDMFAEEFEESRGKVEELVWNHCRETTWLPPAGGKASWLGTLLVNHLNKIAELLHLQPIVIAKSVYHALISYGDLDEKQARQVANKIHNETITQVNNSSRNEQARHVANRTQSDTKNPHRNERATRLANKLYNESTPTLVANTTGIHRRAWNLCG